MTEALAAAARSFFQPRIFRLVWMPLLGALLLWILVGLFFWHPLVAGVQHLIFWSNAAQWLGFDPSGWIAQGLVSIVMFLLLLPLTHATALFVTAIFAMPLMTREVGRRDYPELALTGGSSFAASLWNAVWATAVYLLLCLVTLPLWLFGLPAFLLPLLLNGWYNTRLFRFDALADHASAAEAAQLSRRQGSVWYGLGLCSALLQMVPLLNLISPVYSGLSFIHFGLGQLRHLRAAPALAGRPAEVLSRETRSLTDQR